MALLVLSEEAVKQPKLTLETRLQSTLNAVNSNLESHQKLDHMLVINEEWTIDNGLLTPTLKVKRHVLEERYKSVILAGYREPVVWIN